MHEIKSKVPDTDFLSKLSSFQKNEEFCDVKLHCEDGEISAHKIVLAYHSPYLANIFRKNTSYPTTVCFPSVYTEEMNAIITYMYTGKVLVGEHMSDQVLKLSHTLKMTGLEIVISKEENSPVRVVNGTPSLEEENSSLRVENDSTIIKKENSSLRMECDTNINTETILNVDEVSDSEDICSKRNRRQRVNKSLKAGVSKENPPNKKPSPQNATSPKKKASAVINPYNWERNRKATPNDNAHETAKQTSDIITDDSTDSEVVSSTCSARKRFKENSYEFDVPAATSSKETIQSSKSFSKSPVNTRMMSKPSTSNQESRSSEEEHLSKEAFLKTPVAVLRATYCLVCEKKVRCVQDHKIRHQKEYAEPARYRYDKDS